MHMEGLVLGLLCTVMVAVPMTVKVELIIVVYFVNQTIFKLHAQIVLNVAVFIPLDKVIHKLYSIIQ